MKLSSSNYDEMICVLTIQAIIEELENVDINQNDVSGEQKEYLGSFNRLKRMAHCDLLDIAKHSVSVTMNINKERFETMIAKIEANADLMNEFAWAVKNGATNTMLSQLFPTLFNEREIARQRQGDVAFKRRGKIKDEKIQDGIFKVWQESFNRKIIINESMISPSLLRLRVVFEHFHGEYDLGMIYGALSDYVEDVQTILKGH